MYFWKLDEETIRCLINKDEIDQMGFDIEALASNDDAMNDFLDAVVENSLNYVNWNTEHGVQNYVARPLPADQFLLTISCTFPEDAINRDLKQIEKMTKSLKNTITQERIDAILQMDGEEKEKAFQSLTKDLHNVCSGNVPENHREEEPVAAPEVRRTEQSVSKSKRTIPDQVLTFSSFADLLQFGKNISKKMHFVSDLYKIKEDYKLIIRMNQEQSESEALAFTLIAEECGGNSMTLGYEDAYLREHGTPLIMEEALAKLHTF